MTEILLLSNAAFFLCQKVEGCLHCTAKHDPGQQQVWLTPLYWCPGATHPFGYRAGIILAQRYENMCKRSIEWCVVALSWNRWICWLVGVCVVPCPLMCKMRERARRNLLCHPHTGHLHYGSVWDSTGWLDWNSIQMDRQSPASHISSSMINKSRAHEQRQPGGTEPLGAADLSGTPFISVTAHHPHQPETTVFTYTWWPQVAREDPFTVFNSRLIQL